MCCGLRLLPLRVWHGGMARVCWGKGKLLEPPNESNNHVCDASCAGMAVPADNDATSPQLLALHG